MKIKLFILFLALMVNATTIWAAVKIGGLYYNLHSETAAHVTYKSYSGGTYNKGWSITTANIPSSVTYNGKKYSVTSIGDYAFQNCTGLTSVTIPNSVTRIGDYAFQNCTGLTSVTIPNSVTSIGSSAFSYVPNIVYSGKATGSPWGAKSVNGYVDGYLVYSDASKTSLLACSAAAQGEIVIPNSVTSIGERAFMYCTGLTSVTIGNSVKSIGDHAFFGCDSLTSITIPNSVTSIPNYAFSNCDGLTSVTISNSVTSIGNNAFFYCTSLTSITIPNSVTSIGYCAFSYVPNIVYSGKATGSPWGAKSVNGYVDGYLVYSDASKTSLLACSAVAQGDIVIPSSVTSIGQRAFYDCTGLTSIIIPNSVTSIGGSAFRDCTGLTSVTIPNSVTSIGENAFYYCISLTSVTIPNSVTNIGYSVFRECMNLTSVTIGNSVTSIEDKAFYCCISLKSLSIESVMPPTCNNFAFNNTSINTINVPCESIDEYKTAEGWKPYANIIVSKELFNIKVLSVDDNSGRVYAPEYACNLSSIEISAEANEGFRFTQWSDGNTDNPRTMIIDRDTTLTAVFQPIVNGLYDTENQSSSLRKVLENGQIFILLPDGQRINMLGEKQ